MKIAIIKDDFFTKHSTSWGHPWIEYCQRENIEYELIEWHDIDAFDKVLRCDILLWHFSHYSSAEMQHARSFLYSAKSAGLIVYPNFPDVWHFDDKVAQSYALKALRIPTPKNFVFYDMPTISNWLAKRLSFPLVAKLKSGSGSYNVQLIQSQKQASQYAKRMLLGTGFSGTPSLSFKAKSNLVSAKSLTQIFSRIKRVLEFIHTMRQARQLPKEKGYVYFQEYLKNDGFDIKVVVVGDKLSFIGRKNRKNDFRASGGGTLFFDHDIIDQQVIDMAFMAADLLGSVCIGYDFVVESDSKKPYILEISYGFSHVALLSAGGYFDRSGIWYENPMNAPEEILALLITKHRAK